MLPKIHTCEGCQKKYSHKSSLYTHQKFECGKDPKFTCVACTYKTHHKGNLINHLLRKHREISLEETAKLQATAAKRHGRYSDR